MRRWRAILSRRRSVCLSLLLTCAATPPTWGAQGDPDLRFGNGGIATIEVLSGLTEILAVGALDDGRIALLGGSAELQTRESSFA